MATVAIRELEQRLRVEFPFYTANCLKVVATTGDIVPLELKPAQLRIWDALAAQRDAGRPMRIVVPKARKEGVSTMAQALAVWRVTQHHNHNAISVAQDGTTAAELLGMARLMHAHLPADEQWGLKPPIANMARKKELVFGEPSRGMQSRGQIGLNSRLLVDTAGEFEAGRGFTFHTMHGSEVAFWPDAKRKLTALLNAVPDEPNTLVVLESTSNGHNHWRALVMAAIDGLNDFTCVFLPWFEEPQYTRAFLSDVERQEFIDAIGTGPYGASEPWLLEEFALTYEQLHWRRWAIANRCQSDLRVFQQEYPATVEESFLSTSRVRFPSEHIDRARKYAESLPEAVRGTLSARKYKTVRLRHGSVEVPESPLWTPGAGDWWCWTEPEEQGTYVIAVDPAGGEHLEPDTSAMHGVQVIDHRTRAQCAELQAQMDADLLTVQIYLAALHYNKAWIAVETTGGWGLSIVRRIWKDYHYPFVYRQKRLAAHKDSQEDRLGWDTNRTSKVVLEDTMAEVLREGTHGIRSPRLIRELTTYVRDDRGKSGPAPGERSDLLMAMMIAHTTAQELPLRTFKPQGGVVNTTTRAVLSPRLGY